MKSKPLLEKLNLWVGLAAAVATIISLIVYFFPIKSESSTKTVNQVNKTDTVKSNNAVGNSNQQVNGDNNQQAGGDIIKK